MNAHRASAPTGGGCPLHDAAFAADPRQVYEKLRAEGAAGAVELAPGIEGTLVVDHGTALQVLRNTELFPRDSRRWRDLVEGRIAADNPLLPMLGYRPNTMFSDGSTHLRLRKAVTDSLAKLNMSRIRRDVEPIADHLLDQFSERGRADLLSDYAKLLPLLLFNKLFGCPADIGDTLTSSMSAIFDGRDPLRANEELTACLMELIALKRRRPGDDITSWLIQHPSGLTDAELNDQLVMMMGAGVEPERNLIGNTLLLMLSSSGGHDSGPQIEEAMDHVLWNATPIANYAAHYPVQDVDFGGHIAEANTPVLISFAGANGDPRLAEARGNQSKGAHLAWGAGPHACPAKDPAQVIASAAIERLLNALPDLSLAVPEQELRWRPGPFHRALVSLPVNFSPSPANRMAAHRPQPAPGEDRRPHASQRDTSGTGGAGGAGSTREPARKKGFWSTFLDVFRA
ncbi:MULTISPECIES: cytochrome P450 [unclassified Streptomyces]|uniref:cytochrome P450 n=1 Tax=unclassified Streptomyces TaxID=2593676 RepID=UPI00081DB25E|nr:MULTISPECIES: cytochrome P450 [unclassified Streptomyces]MYR25023.1 cytochrome P450 [Streptomyces sp. SID4945]SCD28610.1 Cytochrome P450 [Streptomyces sp. TverLS-915]SCE72258.1 Cytochrome P450 [Streptomyces sp. LcepLS]